MIKKTIIALLSSIILTSTLSYSVAEQNPESFKEDKRIKKFAYDENNVYSLKLYLKTVTSIQFSDSESIESIIIGDSASWEVVRLKSGNIFSLKPIHVGALTNMTVYTSHRVYTFELQAPGAIDQKNVDGAAHSFRINFTYPKTAQELEDLKKHQVGEPFNYSYGVSGQASFRPLEVRDDAYRTEFLLPPGASRPAIYQVGPNNEEQLVNSRMDGRRLIADGTHDFWVLRLGKEYVCIGTVPAIYAKRPDLTAHAKPPVSVEPAPAPVAKSKSKAKSKPVVKSKPKAKPVAKPAAKPAVKMKPATKPKPAAKPKRRDNSIPYNPLNVGR